MMAIKYLQFAWDKIVARSGNELGNRHWRAGRLQLAESAFRSAIKRNPRYAPAYSNLGSLLMGLHRNDEGFRWIEEAARLAPEHPGVQVNLANAYALSGRLAKAIEKYQLALDIEPRNVAAANNIVRPLIEICDWAGLDRHISYLQNFRESGSSLSWLDSISPFNSLFLPLTRKEQMNIASRVAKAYSDKAPKKRSKRFQEKETGDRLRVAYLSSDYHNHPTSHLTMGLYGAHDRSRFEVYCYSIGAPDDSSYRRRILQECDRFTDVHDKSDEHISQLIESDGIDILVDLKGYTGGGRPEILARRPAPIQVSYLGYPGTMGSEFIDYLIADSIVTPPEHSADYTERIIRLPNCYQATDDEQAIAELLPSRLAAGLPADGFVYCCFNTPAKIDRRTFSSWMKVLNGVPSSVLWLLKTTHEAEKNISAAAHSHGVDPGRIIFAPILGKAEHLARLRLADLTLDTFLCNAHTTATDSLWVGVPVLTLTGETFASRVATSLLHAAGVPSLAVRREEDFVQQAIDLASDLNRLVRLSQELERSKKHALFNTKRFVSDIECAYAQMYSMLSRK